jgi:phenylpropionate dioxygenase-like ring-hydroxylating dioxygenase large terminal subunit
MAPYQPEIAHYRMEEVEPIRPVTHDSLNANWKSVRDVDNEGYHVPMAHPSLQDLYGGQYEDRNLKFGVARSEGILNEGAGKLWSVRAYKKILPHVDYLPEKLQRTWVYYGIYPSTVFMLYPDSVGFYQEFPLAPDKTLQRFAYYARPDKRREMKLARYLSSRIDRETGREDAQLIVWSCEATKSSAYTDIILSDAEHGVRAYHDYLRTLIPVVNLQHAPAPGTLAITNQKMHSKEAPANWS